MAGQDARKLERKVRTKIFDYNHEFLPVLTQSIRPSAQVQISFGQRWNFGKSAQGILVVAKVMACVAAEYSTQQSQLVSKHTSGKLGNSL